MRDFIHTIIRFISVTSLALLLGASVVSGQGKQADMNGKNSPHQKIYVCNQGEATLDIIDTETNEITDSIDLKELGFSAKAKPHHTVAEPDGSYWYVTLIGANRVLKFNRENELVGQVEMEVPGLLSLHPTRDLLFVGRSMSAVNPPQSVGIIKRSDMTLEQELSTFFPRPHALATTPSGDRAFIASLAQNQMLSIDTESYETELTRFPGKTHVFVDFAISPDEKTMVATGQVTGKALVMDISDPASPSVTDTMDVNAQPWHPVFSADGKYVYFGNKEAHTVTVLNMESKRVETVIEGQGLAQPHGSALSADGEYLYISNNNRKGTYKAAGTAQNGEPRGTVTVISTKTHKIEKIIEVGNYPTGIGTQAW